jgi:hypothetical protein
MMPRGSRLRDYLMRRDGRNPYGSEGGYVTSRRSRRDRGMDYADYRRDYRGGDYEYGSRRSDMAYSEQDMARGRRDYESMGQSDMAYDNMDMRRRRNSRGQYMSDRAYDGEDYGSFHEERGFRPVEAMGYFTGYYGGGQDMARGGRRDYGYDMGYDMRGRDYGYDYAGDYGENLTKEELEHWRKKLDKEVGDEQSKNFFKKENIEQKARQMGIEMKHFSADELALASYMLYSDYCKSIKPYVGQNMDIFIKMGEEFLNDPDSAVKGGEKLALYHEIVSGE